MSKATTESGGSRAVDSTAAVPRVVVCGGGAGGLELAIRLSRRGNLQVELVDRQPTHLWKPLLHEVASGSLDAATHAVSYLSLARRHRFMYSMGRLEDIDRNGRSIGVGPVTGEGGVEIIPRRRISYDVLVIGIGGTSNDFGVPGAREHALVLDNLADAERVHARILQACMAASFGDEASRPRAFDVVIVGGGATGVELAAELRSTTRTLLEHGLREINPELFVRLAIVNADQRLLVQLPERISSAVERTLTGLSIEVLNSRQVVRIEPSEVVFKSGERRRSDLTIWAAGVKAPEVLKAIGGLETNRLDQIVVAATLQSRLDQRIFALGDCAAAPWAGTSGNVPPRAQAAQQQAMHLARSIPALLKGEAPPPFRYNNRGSLLSLGDSGAVGRLMGFVRGAGFEVEGLVARLIYRWLYLRHRAALFGWFAVGLESLGRWIGASTRPAVKLH